MGMTENGYIAELKAANALLELEAKRYKAFSELVHESFFEYDAETGGLQVFGDTPMAREYGSGRNGVRVSPHNRSRFMDVFEKTGERMDGDFVLEDGKGGERWYHIAARAINDEDGGLNRIIGTFRDIQAQKTVESNRAAYEARLREKAVYDGVTRLLNRSATEELVDLRLAGIGRRDVCLLLDIDDFKALNDRYGHMLGDRVLQEVACVLRTCCRPYDVTGRIGGDEFFVMFCDVPDLFDARERERKILAGVHTINKKLGVEERITVSMGDAQVTCDDQSFTDVYSRADKAMYQAKLAGKNTVRSYGE